MPSSSGSRRKRAGSSRPAGRVPSALDLDRAAAEVAARLAEPALSFDADFENGCLDRVVRLGPDWYHIRLRPDTFYRFHFRVRGCRGRELVFEFTCRNTNNPKLDGGRCYWHVEDPPSMPLVSYDGRRWEPVSRLEKHAEDPGTYRFTHRFTADEAYFCYQHPYTYSDMLAWLRTLRIDPRLTIEELGRTRNGFAEPLVTVAGDPPARDLVVLIAREDADEETGSWGIEGLVRALLAPACRPLLKRYTFRVVPMVGIDGVVAGAHHSAGYGYGGWRWHEQPAPPEIENVKRGVRAWVAGGERLALAGKLHGYKSFRSGDSLCDGIMTASPELQSAVEAGILSCSKGTWQHGGKKNLAIRPPGYFEHFIVDEFGLFEVFATHIGGDTPENARRGGEALMHGLAAYLGFSGARPAGPGSMRT